MRINIGEYEIEIKAKRNWEEKMSKKTTMETLNTICIWAGEAAEHMKSIGLPELANDYIQKEHELYKILKDNGLYNE